MACRDPDKAQAVADTIDGNTEVRRLDLADLASVRAFADGLGGRRRRIDQQRGGHGGAQGDDGRRVRAAHRHQPPRAVRAHRLADQPRPRPRRHRVPAACTGSAGSRRPELGTPPLPTVAGLRAVQAGQPAVRLRAAATAVRGGPADHVGGGAPRRRRDRGDAPGHVAAGQDPRRRARAEPARWARCRSCTRQPRRRSRAAPASGRTGSCSATATPTGPLQPRRREIPASPPSCGIVPKASPAYGSTLISTNSPYHSRSLMRLIWWLDGWWQQTIRSRFDETSQNHREVRHARRPFACGEYSSLDAATGADR